jgi:HAD superfamily phosphoserine phosphatase-like hydrolase
MEKNINIILDFDSTLVTIEGIDKLAKLKNLETEVTKITNQVMSGEINTELAFTKRLEIIKPNYKDLNLVSKLYLNNITEGAKNFINRHRNHTNIFVVSGGYKQAIIKTTNELGIEQKNVFANELLFDHNDNYIALNHTIPLWKTQGKNKVINDIKRNYPYKTILIGDGYSDLEAESTVDLFFCFTGVVHRKSVVEKSNYVLEHFDLINILEENYQNQVINDQSIFGSI